MKNICRFVLFNADTFFIMAFTYLATWAFYEKNMFLMWLDLAALAVNWLQVFLKWRKKQLVE